MRKNYGNVWDPTIPPGGYVCEACGMPTESEPCYEHQSENQELVAATVADYITSFGLTEKQAQKAAQYMTSKASDLKISLRTSQA